MSWLYSRALVEEYLGGGCSDGEQSVPSSGNPTQLAYLPPDRMTKFSRLSQFGMTFKPLTESRGEELLMSYLEGFLAKIYPVQEEAQELKEADQECGNTWLELSARYDLDSHSWRTHQCLWDEALQWSSVTLPKWGMTVSGVLFQHPTAERPISGTGSGSLAYATGLTQKPTHSVPTPTASDHIERVSSSKEVLNFETNKTVSLNRWANHWPTPTCNMVSGGPNHLSPSVQAGKHGLNLAGAITMWPTPTAHNAKEAAYPAEFLRKTPTLAATVAMRKFPTPQASDNRDRGNLGSPATLRRKEKGKQISLGQSVSDISGALNPTWVEWLMGWPLGWTDLKPLEMAKYQQWQQQHSGFYQEQQLND